jgi:hypothetical protein
MTCNSNVNCIERDDGLQIVCCEPGAIGHRGDPAAGSWLLQASPIGFSTTVLLTTSVIELILAKLQQLAPRSLGEGPAKRWRGEVYTVTKQARGVVYLT